MYRGMKRAQKQSNESSGDEKWEIMAEVMKTCWAHSSVNNELDLLKSWSIGGTHVARSPIQALQDVFKAVQVKQNAMSQVSEALKKLGQEGYEPDFSLYHLVALACTHLRHVYTFLDELKVHAGRLVRTFPRGGATTKTRLPQVKYRTIPWLVNDLW